MEKLKKGLVLIEWNSEIKVGMKQNNSNTRHNRGVQPKSATIKRETITKESDENLGQDCGSRAEEKRKTKRNEMIEEKREEGMEHNYSVFLFVVAIVLGGFALFLKKSFYASFPG